MIERIEYHGIYYPIRTVSINDWGDNLVIATEDLQKHLFNDLSSGYENKEAQYIDEQIFFYINPNEINLSAPYLSKFIAGNL